MFSLFFYHMTVVVVIGGGGGDGHGYDGCSGGNFH